MIQSLIDHPNTTFTEDINKPLLTILMNLDEITFFHCIRTCQLSVELGKAMNLSGHELNLLKKGALLHDIGKAFIPLKLLNKTSKLEAEEWKIIKSHPDIGCLYLKAFDLEDPIKQIILNHHRWANGKGGYPESKNLRIPSLLTQIVTVADVIDAMTSTRPYRQPLSFDVCISYLQNRINTMFNADIIKLITEQKIMGGELA